jgi:hypothetical protein
MKVILTNGFLFPKIKKCWELLWLWGWWGATVVNSKVKAFAAAAAKEAAKEAAAKEAAANEHFDEGAYHDASWEVPPSPEAEAVNAVEVAAAAYAVEQEAAARDEVQAAAAHAEAQVAAALAEALAAPRAKARAAEAAYAVQQEKTADARQLLDLATNEAARRRLTPRRQPLARF